MTWRLGGGGGDTRRRSEDRGWFPGLGLKIGGKDSGRNRVVKPRRSDVDSWRDRGAFVTAKEAREGAGPFDVPEEEKL